jgi:hypothetical protein
MSERDDVPDGPRPWDPAGTQPKHDPSELLPASSEPLLPPDAEVVDSDAIDDDDRDLLPERRKGAAAPAVAPAAGGSAFAPRFHFLTGVLVAVGLAAIAGIAVFVIGPSTKGEGPQWSRWKPTSSGMDGAAQIARHVGSEYRDGGQQLVNVEATGLDYRGVPLSIAVRKAPEQGGDIQIHDDKGLIYQLCGLGQNCSIENGKPSKERTFLLRREGLELALYSFRYLDVKQVVVLIPPPPGKEQTIALYFRRDDVRAELNRPLTSSLVPRAPTVNNVTLSPDATLVDQATDDSFFVFSLMGSNFDDRGFMVLDPYTPQADAQRQAALKKLREQAQQQATAPSSSGG